MRLRFGARSNLLAPDDSNTPRNQLPVRRHHYYGGAWHASVGGGEMPVGSPATGESLGSVRVADAQDVDRAVRAAQEGFERWRDTPAQERAACIRHAIAAMRAHAE